MSRFFKAHRKYSEEEDLKIMKEKTDKNWDRVFNDVLNGKIDHIDIVDAMNMCNVIDLKYFQAGILEDDNTTKRAPS